MYGIGEHIAKLIGVIIVISALVGWLVIEGFIWLIQFLYEHLEWV